MIKVLFVCLGNICRSPTAEGVFRKVVSDAGLAERVIIDSAGTHAYHVGEPPDVRAQTAAARRGIDLSALRGRRATRRDLESFDYVLAMDRENYEHLLDICPPGLETKIRLLLEFAPHRPEREVPDPYFGGDSGFDRVLDMVEEAAHGLLAHIRREHL
ncbi:MAG TPA: low molecular weight protein-tyrosine-phosphatase [Acidiferrobacterales bacterium]